MGLFYFAQNEISSEVLKLHCHGNEAEVRGVRKHLPINVPVTSSSAKNKT